MWGTYDIVDGKPERHHISLVNRRDPRVKFHMGYWFGSYKIVAIASTMTRKYNLHLLPEASFANIG